MLLQIIVPFFSGAAGGGRIAEYKPIKTFDPAGHYINQILPSCKKVPFDLTGWSDLLRKNLGLKFDAKAAKINDFEVTLQ